MHGYGKNGLHTNKWSFVGGEGQEKQRKEIEPPSSVSSHLGSWLRNFSLELRNQILVGATAPLLGHLVE